MPSWGILAIQAALSAGVTAFFLTISLISKCLPMLAIKTGVYVGLSVVFGFSWLGLLSGPASMSVSAIAWWLGFASLGFIVSIASAVLVVCAFGPIEVAILKLSRRPVILLLRPFHQKSTTAQVPHRAYNGKTETSAGQSIESRLLPYLTRAGLVVSISDSVESTHTFSASDENWREVVEETARLAALIVLIPASSEGVMTEAELLLTDEFRYKSLIFMPPLRFTFGSMLKATDRDAGRQLLDEQDAEVKRVQDIFSHLGVPEVEFHYDHAFFLDLETREKRPAFESSTVGDLKHKMHVAKRQTPGKRFHTFKEVVVAVNRANAGRSSNS